MKKNQLLTASISSLFAVTNANAQNHASAVIRQRSENLCLRTCKINFQMPDRLVSECNKNIHIRNKEYISIS